jgi:hypothetical protein
MAFVWRDEALPASCCFALVRELLAAIYEADRKHGRAEDRKEALRKLREAESK